MTASDALCQNQFAGHCYQHAAAHQRENPKHGGTLVHGSVESGGKRFLHAWVDEGPQIGVFDPEHQKHFSHEEYKSLSPQEHARYSDEEAGVNMLKHGHWGPWS